MNSDENQEKTEMFRKCSKNGADTVQKERYFDVFSLVKGQKMTFGYGNHLEITGRARLLLIIFILDY